MSQERRMPTKSAIKNHWDSQLVLLGKFDSIEEVWEADYCFACGMLDGKDDAHFTERAHIFARAKGGKDTPDNLHLLCHLCHIASEHLSGEDYFAWFRERNLQQVIFQLVGKERPNILAKLLSKLLVA